MCRFVAFIGNQALGLRCVLVQPSNSLINQSRQAREGLISLNADGYGIGWYDHAIKAEPAVFRSIQPAWNDDNFEALADILSSSCFIGHVRASTIGEVTRLNCHPFHYQRYLFVHNGSLHHFNQLKRQFLSTLNDDIFHHIKGQTDSEYFFALVMQYLQLRQTSGLDDLQQAFLAALAQVKQWQRQLNLDDALGLNTVLTDGHQLLATRYVSSHKEKPISLYYASSDDINFAQACQPCQENNKAHFKGYLLASEPLNDFAKHWQIVPENHFLRIDQNLNVSLTAIVD